MTSSLCTYRGSSKDLKNLFWSVMVPIHVYSSNSKSDELQVTFFHKNSYEAYLDLCAYQLVTSVWTSCCPWKWSEVLILWMVRPYLSRNEKLTIRSISGCLQIFGSTGDTDIIKQTNHVIRYGHWLSTDKLQCVQINSSVPCGNGVPCLYHGAPLILKVEILFRGYIITKYVNSQCISSFHKGYKLIFRTNKRGENKFEDLKQGACQWTILCIKQEKRVWTVNSRLLRLLSLSLNPAA